MGQLVFQATAGGQVALVGPNPSTSFSINVPAINGNLITSGDTGTVTNTMLASNVYTAPGTIGSVTPNTGAFTNLAYTGTLTGGTGIVNLGSGQFYKDASGNVGIGTSTPSTKLTVLTATNGGILVTDGTYTGIMYASGLGGIVAGTTSAHPYIVFSNNAERMRITSAGAVCIGTTAQINAGLLNLAFDTGVYAAIAIRPTNNAGYDAARFFNSSTTQIGSISCTGSATSYVTSSDYRLKENIAPMTGALAKVAQLKPVTYKWKATGEESQGFIAHELAEIVPDCVTGAKDAVNEDGSIMPQGIDTSFLVATLTAAIQELNAKVDAQALEIATLKAK